MKSQLSFILLFLATSTFYLASVSYAQTMQNENHTLFLDPIDDPTIQPLILTPSPSIPPSAKPKKRKTLTEPPHTNISIYINKNHLLFGILSPTSPSNRAIGVSLSGTTPSQTLFVRKNADLVNNSGSVIPDTTCDLGGCSEYIGSDWKNTLTFGYGYSCSESYCDQDFQSSGFRPFSENLVSIFQGRIGPGNKKTMTIPIRINIPGTQENGSYTTSVTILSTPSL